MSMSHRDQTRMEAIMDEKIKEALGLADGFEHRIKKLEERVGAFMMKEGHRRSKAKRNPPCPGNVATNGGYVEEQPGG